MFRIVLEGKLLRLIIKEIRYLLFLIIEYRLPFETENLMQSVLSYELINRSSASSLIFKSNDHE